MFTKILIANRGEIACRIMRTAKRLGIATVAVYSDADAGARHVRLADEAVRIGPAAAAESYLSTAKILAAARTTGAQAIHPGYGFLSENAAFAQACQDAGLVFIGPPVAAIEAMGSKSAAKALMERADVPLTPGYHGDRQDAAFLADQAARIGYPVLIKASAGGGGKGMRRVDAAGDFAQALASCQREAASAFGNDHVLIEKYILSPRHIEIQVFGDTHGNLVHLFERDCSVQRRHQKVLEEAPAPGMTPERRAAMGAAAVEAARAVGYTGAGTVEFIAHPDGSFYFMEMNTRLQVEHPVTEMITGVDLVEWQLRVAAGEPLPRRQDELTLQGHALEARIYAEDADNGFLPSPGWLARMVHPRQTDHVRVDTGVDEGDVITPYYDPMIAKLIVHGRDRNEALARMQQALAEYRVVGVTHNIGFLARLVGTAAFSQADLDTGLIEREHAALFPAKHTPPPAAWMLTALNEVLADGRAQDTPDPWHAADAWRLNLQGAWRIRLTHGEQEDDITIEPMAAGYRVAWRDQVVPAQASRDAQGRLVAYLGEQRWQADVMAAASTRHVYSGGESWVFDVRDRLDAGDVDDDVGGLRAPMPGRIIAHLVDIDQAVDKGTPLLVMEAMKMEHTIHAPAAGHVSRFLAATGDQVGDGDELLTFERSAT